METAIVAVRARVLSCLPNNRRLAWFGFKFCAWCTLVQFAYGVQLGRIPRLIDARRYMKCSLRERCVRDIMPRSMRALAVSRDAATHIRSVIVFSCWVDAPQACFSKREIAAGAGRRRPCAFNVRFCFAFPPKIVDAALSPILKWHSEMSSEKPSLKSHPKMAP